MQMLFDVKQHRMIYCHSNGGWLLCLIHPSLQSLPKMLERFFRIDNGKAKTVLPNCSTTCYSTCVFPQIPIAAQSSARKWSIDCVCIYGIGMQTTEQINSETDTTQQAPQHNPTFAFYQIILSIVQHTHTNRHFDLMNTSHAIGCDFGGLVMGGWGALITSHLLINRNGSFVVVRTLRIHIMAVGTIVKLALHVSSVCVFFFLSRTMILIALTLNNRSTRLRSRWAHKTGTLGEQNRSRGICMRHTHLI